MHCRPGAGSGEAKDSRANREMVSSDVAQNSTDNPTCGIMKDAVVKWLGGRSLGNNLQGAWRVVLSFKRTITSNVGVPC
jgi:hypothetical protein